MKGNAEEKASRTSSPRGRGSFNSVVRGSNGGMQPFSLPGYRHRIPTRAKPGEDKPSTVPILLSRLVGVEPGQVPGTAGLHCLRRDWLRGPICGEAWRGVISHMGSIRRRYLLLGAGQRIRPHFRLSEAFRVGRRGQWADVQHVTPVRGLRLPIAACQNTRIPSPRSSPQSRRAWS